MDHRRKSFFLQPVNEALQTMLPRKKNLNYEAKRSSPIKKKHGTYVKMHTQRKESSIQHHLVLYSQFFLNMLTTFFCILPVNVKYAKCTRKIRQISV